MTDYLDLALTADATELYQDGIEAVQAITGDDWTPSPPEQGILAAVARMAVEVVILAGTVPLDIFKYFGQTVLKIAAIEAVAATGTVEFTVVPDPGGRVIDAGAELDIDGFGFQTAAPLTIPAATTTGQVGIVAIDAGIESSGLTGDTVDLVSPTIVWVDSVALIGVTAGGQDGETGQAYVDRLPDELSELSPKVVLWSDAEGRARRNPAVARAVAINRYDPGPPVDTDAEGHISVFVHDTAGAPLGSTDRDEIAADMEANRINGLVVHVEDPTYTRVDVRFTFRPLPGWDPATVETEAEQAVTDFLNPAQWGSHGTALAWEDEPVLLRNDLIAVVRNAPGVRHVDTLTLARYGDTQDTVDITLDGPAALPAADSVVDGTPSP